MSNEKPKRNNVLSVKDDEFQRSTLSRMILNSNHGNDSIVSDRKTGRMHSFKSRQH